MVGLGIFFLSFFLSASFNAEQSLPQQLAGLSKQMLQKKYPPICEHSVEPKRLKKNSILFRIPKLQPFV